MQNSLNECKTKMQKSIESLERELAKVRTGRASASLLDSVRVDYYGSPTPLNQVASISIPDARSIVIAPFEKKIISEVERAIQMSNLGIQPSNDGNVVRLPIPPLNAERRKEIAKSLKKIGETAKISIRQVRQDFNSKMKQAEKSKETSEDESRQLQKEAQTQTDSYVKIVDEKVSAKEKEVMTV
ncbi:MAG: ribosome recycling factor [Oligoflexales bacterium]